MAEISDRLERMIDEFAKNKNFPVTSEMVNNLRACIVSSPELTEQLNRAAASGSVTSIRPMADDGRLAGAVFNQKAIELPLKSLGSDFNVHQLAFVLGHETQHSFNAAERAKLVDGIVKDMARIAKNPDQGSYDGLIDAWKHVSRTDEAKATLAGWNAAVSQLQKQFKDDGTDRAVTLHDMWANYGSRAADFIDPTLDANGRISGYRLKDGITLREDLTVDVNSPGNVAAMGQYYYDDPQKAVGHARSSYANYDGANIVSTIIDIERRFRSTRMTIDLASHGMSEDKLEINGIDLGRNIQQRQPYIDTSHGQQRLGYFDHTLDARVSSAQSHQYVPTTPSMLPSSRASGFDDPRHPEHALYSEIKQRLPPETSADRLTQITSAASRGGIQSGEVSRIDVVHTTLYLQGAIPGDRAVVDLASAPPAREDTMREYDRFEQQRTQLMQQSQALDRHNAQETLPSPS